MNQCTTESFPHKIQQGDDLWQLAQRYNTTVTAIISINPKIKPYSLYVDQIVCIPTECAINKEEYIITNEEYTNPIEEHPISKAELDLRYTFRELWEQHVAWTRMTIISTIMNLPDVNLVTNRLLRNPTDFEIALKPLYGNEIASKFGKLLRDHLVIAGQLIEAAKNKDVIGVERVEKNWYANADEIATFLSSINPNWPKQALLTMLHEHLALTKAEAVARLSNDYANDIAIYDNIEKQALSMADGMSAGIVKQFPRIYK